MKISSSTVAKTFFTAFAGATFAIGIIGIIGASGKGTGLVLEVGRVMPKWASGILIAVPILYGGIVKMKLTPPANDSDYSKAFHNRRGWEVSNSKLWGWWEQELGRELKVGSPKPDQALVDKLP